MMQITPHTKWGEVMDHGLTVYEVLDSYIKNYMETQVNPKFDNISLDEAIKLWGTSRQGFFKMLKKGKFHVVEGTGKRRIFSKKEITQARMKTK